MNEERLLSVLKAPRLSEKLMHIDGDSRQYIFKVSSDTNKLEIKQAVEHLFKVNVKSVQVLNVKAKTKRFRQVLGKRKGWKKAYVVLESGQELNIGGEAN